MRIAVLDNVANNAYIAAKALRRLGAEVDVVLDPGDRFVMSDPRWDEIELTLPPDRLDSSQLPPTPLPTWVRRPQEAPARGRTAALAVAARLPGPSLRAIRIAGRQGLAVIAERRGVVVALRGYDVVLGFGIGAMFAALAGVPCVAHTWGGDIMMMPFYDEEPDATPRQVALARLQRWGYRSAHRILLAEPRYRGAAERLGLGHKAAFTPYFIDTDMYTPGEEPELRQALLEGAEGRVIFVPSRQDWRWKGSDVMLRGFARLDVERVGHVVLICSGWGADLERSKALAAELGILDRVRFLPYAMSKPLLVRHYRAADVCLDQFTLNSLGGSSFEAMSCARPLVTSLDVPAFVETYGEQPPLAESRTPEAVHASLHRLLTDPRAAAELGAAARAFVRRHYGEQLARNVLRYCREAVA